MSASTALHTDRYELTMLDAALRDGTAGRRCVFEVFARRLPGARRFGVVAGTGRLLGLIRDFRFGDEELRRSEEHTSELQSLMRISYAVFCLKKKKTKRTRTTQRDNMKIETKKHQT